MATSEQLSFILQSPWVSVWCLHCLGSLSASRLIAFVKLLVFKCRSLWARVWLQHIWSGAVRKLFSGVKSKELHACQQLLDMRCSVPGSLQGIICILQVQCQNQSRSRKWVGVCCVCVQAGGVQLCYMAALSSTNKVPFPSTETLGRYMHLVACNSLHTASCLFYFLLWWEGIPLCRRNFRICGCDREDLSQLYLLPFNPNHLTLRK